MVCINWRANTPNGDGTAHTERFYVILNTRNGMKFRNRPRRRERGSPSATGQQQRIATVSAEERGSTIQLLRRNHVLPAHASGKRASRMARADTIGVLAPARQICHAFAY